MQSSAVDHKVPCKPPNCILCLSAVVPNTDSFSLLLPRIEAQLAWDCLLSKPEYLILHKYHLTCATVASNTYMDTVRSHVLQVKVYWAYWFTSEQPPHSPTSLLPLHGPIDLHHSVRLWLQSTLTPCKGLWMDEMLQDPRGTVSLQAVWTDVESSVWPKQTASVRLSETNY